VESAVVKTKAILSGDVRYLLAAMFLRPTIRKKDDKEHRYWSLVENKRVSGGRVYERALAIREKTLGPDTADSLNDGPYSSGPAARGERRGRSRPWTWRPAGLRCGPQSQMNPSGDRRWQSSALASVHLAAPSPTTTNGAQKAG
jgi:hypothetical protein